MILNICFLLVCGLLHFMSVSFLFLYVIEEKQGCAPDGYEVYQYYCRFLFRSSLIIAIVLWLTITEMQGFLFILFIISLLVWVASTLILFLLSFGKSLKDSSKHNIRVATRRAVINMMIQGIVVWLFCV